MNVKQVTRIFDTLAKEYRRSDDGLNDFDIVSIAKHTNVKERSESFVVTFTRWYQSTIVNREETETRIAVFRSNGDAFFKHSDMIAS